MHVGSLIISYTALSYVCVCSTFLIWPHVMHLSSTKLCSWLLLIPPQIIHTPYSLNVCVCEGVLVDEPADIEPSSITFILYSAYF